MTTVYEAVQPPDAADKFRIGQCVSHRDQILPSLVTGRTETKNGLHIYGIRSFAAKDDQRDRMIIGDCLLHVVPGSEPCFDCLLFNTGICPSV